MQVSFTDDAGYGETLTSEATAAVRVPVSIEAEYETLGAGIEDLVLTLRREGATTDELDVTVTLSQEREWLDTADLSHEVTFRAGNPTAELTIGYGRFSLTPTTRGDLTAAVGGDGIAGGSETLEVISVDGPLVKTRLGEASYEFAENGGAWEVEVVLEVAPDLPRVGRDLKVDLASRSDTAVSPGDFRVVSEIALQAGQFNDTDEGLRGTVTVPLALVNDDVYEGEETLRLRLSAALGTRSGVVNVLALDGTVCPAVFCSTDYPVTITDEEDLPVLSLTASPTTISEADDGATEAAENASTVTVAIDNAKTFAAEQVVTLAFAGTAPGADYAVDPADEGSPEGHQVTLPAGDDSVEVSLTATDNAALDGDRTVAITGSRAGVVFGATQTITITDDERPNTPATGQPVITGTAEVGETLAAGQGDIDDIDGLPATFPDDYSFQWMRVDADGTSNATDVAGATLDTYTPVVEDFGKKVRVMVRFTDDGGSDEELTSDPYPSSGTVEAGLAGICGRTQAVQDAIIEILGAPNCLVFDAELATITGTLDLSSESITGLATGDFAGLIALEELDLFGNALTTLPNDVFAGLTSLTVLHLNGNELATLPADIFEPLPALEELHLTGNELSTLPAGVFAGLTALTSLRLDSNELVTLPAGVFAGLTALEDLHLTGNELSTLPAGVFAGLTALTSLRLDSNDLATLPDDVFEPLTALAILWLQGNPRAPFAPEAVALPDDGVVSNGGTVRLNGSDSDGGPWGTNVTYGWALTDPASGVTVRFNDDASVTTEVTIPALATDTELTFTLTVTGRGGTRGIAPGTDTATVTANATGDATLDSLTVSDGTSDLALAPAFASGRFIYTASVTNDVDEVTLTAMTTDDGASVSAVTLDGTAISDNDFTDEITVPSLLVGENAIVVTVTAEDATTTQTYTVRVTRANSAPTASDASVTTNEDTAHTFEADEFNFADSDPGAALASVTVVTRPAAGTLALNGTAVTAGRVVPAADIGTLTFTPAANANGPGYASFTFKVSDGTDKSASAYTMTVHVTAVQDLATGAPMISGTAWVGGMLTAATTDIVDVDGLTSPTYRYQWVRVDADGTSNATDVAGATLDTYTPVVEDFGKKVRVKVRFTDDGGSDEELTSDPYPSSGTVEAGLAGICGRTQAVQDAIIEILGAANCLVFDTELATITGTLDLSSESITGLATGDFAGLIALEELDLFGNALTMLPNDVFAGLTSLTVLHLNGNELATLPADIFEPLTALEELHLTGNELATLPADVFAGLTALTSLRLTGNELATLPAGVFAGLTALEDLHLTGNELSTLPADVFEPLTALTILRLDSNELATLPAGVFAGLTALTSLRLDSNDLDTLPDDVFEPLTALTILRLQNNPRAPFAPEAVALPDDGAVSNGGAVRLNGSDSDGGPWGTNVTYGWALTDPASGVTVMFKNDASVTTEVTIPALATDTELTFTLTVTGRGGTRGIAPGTDTATVTANATGDATLDSLTVSDGASDLALAPAFASGRFIYTASVTNDVDEVTLTAMTTDDGASVSAVTLNGTAISDNDFTDEITVPSLRVGENAIVVTVTAEDATTTQTYTVRVTRANSAPTASDASVTTNEDTAHTFEADEFNFADSDPGAALASVTVVTRPAAGTLALNGTAVTAGRVVPAADIGTLTFTPAANANGPGYASFTFKVSDGMDKSALAYTMTVHVTAVQDLATGAPMISGTAWVGGMLTAATTDIVDVDGLTSATYRYQWVRVDADGSNPTDIGTDSSTYPLVAADEGKKIKVKVSFTDDDGNDEELTSDAYPATGTVEAAPNVAPAFTSSATFDVVENQTTVGTVQATDADDSVTGYTIEGGEDQSKFSIVSLTGVLTFGSAPDFEAPTDADGNNDYVVVVQATSGTDARKKTADQTITVTVTDEKVAVQLGSVTIDSNYPRIGAGLEDLVFTLTRPGGAVTEELEARVTLSQDRAWLDTAKLSPTVTFEAGSADATLRLAASLFSFDPDTTGDLTATVEGVGIAGDSATVEIISMANPPITVRYDQSSYTFAEDAAAEDVNIYMEAELDSAYPRAPTRAFFVTFATSSDTAISPGDYGVVSRQEEFSNADFTPEGSGFVASKRMGAFVVKNDDVYEGAERLFVNIQVTSDFPAGLAQFKYPNGNTCKVGTCTPDPAYEVTITDEGDLPVLSLTASPTTISEADDGATEAAENASTVTVAIDNAKTFAAEQVVTLAFAGTAPGADYAVDPADEDSLTRGPPGHAAGGRRLGGGVADRDGQRRPGRRPDRRHHRVACRRGLRRHPDHHHHGRREAEHARDRAAGHHRHGRGGRDAGRRSGRHRRHRRSAGHLPGRLQLPVGAGGCRRRQQPGGHRDRHGRDLRPGRGRHRQETQGAGELHRRRRLWRDPDQRGDGRGPRAGVDRGGI